MSICKPLPLPPIPSIPPIFSGVGSPTVPKLSFGTPGETCCAFQIPGINISLPIIVPGISVVLQPIIAVLEAEIDAGLAILDQISVPPCVL